MTLAIDYDGTYSLYQKEFDILREMFQQRGCEVYIVTARCKDKLPIQEDLSKFDKVIYTNGKAKASIVHADIFIDDCPVMLCCDFDSDNLTATPSSDLYQNYLGDSYLWHFEDNGFKSYKQEKDFHKK